MITLSILCLDVMKMCSLNVHIYILCVAGRKYFFLAHIKCKYEHSMNTILEPLEKNDQEGLIWH